MISCKSNKDNDTSSQSKNEDVYTFKNTNDFLDSVKNNEERYVNKRVEISEGYCSLLEDDNDSTYSLYITNNLGNSTLMLYGINKKGVDTTKFKESIYFGSETFRIIDTQKGEILRDIDNKTMYEDEEDGHVYDIFDDIRRVLRYEEYNEEYNKEDIPRKLKKIISTPGYENFIEDMKVGRYTTMTSQQFEDLYQTTDLPLTKVSFTSTYVGHREVKSDMIGVKDKNGNVDGMVFGSHLFNNVVFNKIETLSIPKEFKIPNKSIDFSNYLSQTTTN